MGGIYLWKGWKHIVGVVIALSCSYILGFTYVAHHRSHFPNLGETLQLTKVRGEIVSLPTNYAAESRVVIKLSHHGRDTRILTKIPPYPRFAYGDIILVSGVAKRPEVIDNFDYPLFLEKQGINHVIQKGSLTFVEHGDTSVQSLLYRFRAKLEARSEGLIPEPEASLLNGILLGSRQNLPQSLTEELRATGTSHIVAISGANITIVVNLLVALLPFSSLRAKFRETVLIGLCLSLMTGASASVVRGSAVACLASFVRVRGRKSNVWGLIFFPATCMILINPLYLKSDPSFQLSLSAYVGITLLAKPLTATLKKSLTLVPETLRGALIETAAASIGTLPVSLLQFGSLSWIGLLANPAVLWLIPFITILGGIFLLYPLPILTTVLWFLLHMFLTIIHLFSRLAHA